VVEIVDVWSLHCQPFFLSRFSRASVYKHPILSFFNSSIKMFNGDDEQNNPGESNGKVYTFDDQVFSEIEVDETPPEDDESVTWTDAGDNVEEVDDDEMITDTDVNDMAHCVFSGHKDSVYCIAAHPTQPGVVITGGGDDVAYIWTYDTNLQPVQDISDANENDIVNGNNKILSTIELLGHTDTVTAVGFNFNGSLALTGSYDGTVRIWRVETGELIQTLEGPEDVEWAEWHSKGNAVIAGSRDGSIWMWLTQNGQCVQVFAGMCSQVNVASTLTLCT
jgi:WD40 repeat protein